MQTERFGRKTVLVLGGFLVYNYFITSFLLFFYLRRPLLFTESNFVHQKNALLHYRHRYIFIQLLLKFNLDPSFPLLSLVLQGLYLNVPAKEFKTRD